MRGGSRTQKTQLGVRCVGGWWRRYKCVWRQDAKLEPHCHCHSCSSVVWLCEAAEVAWAVVTGCVGVGRGQINTHSQCGLCRLRAPEQNAGGHGTAAGVAGVVKW